MPQEIIDTHELQTITLDYRRECQQDDVVDSLTTPEPVIDDTVPELQKTNGSLSAAKGENEPLQFLHLLRLSNDGLEINRGRTEWRKKPAKRWAQPPPIFMIYPFMHISSVSFPHRSSSLLSLFALPSFISHFVILVFSFLNDLWEIWGFCLNSFKFLFIGTRWLIFICGALIWKLCLFVGLFQCQPKSTKDRPLIISCSFLIFYVLIDAICK